MEPGQRVNSASATTGGLGFLFGFGRFVGFLLLAAPALATVAALVLLPAYQHMTEQAYETEKLRSDNQSIKDYIASNDRLIEDAPVDEDLTTRLRISNARLLPRNEVVVVDPNAPPAPPPGVIVPAHRPYAPKPDNLLLSMAGKLSDDNTRRGLFLLSAVAMMAAMFLFAPPESYVQKPGTRD